MTGPPSIQPTDSVGELTARASEATGLEDFGSDSWREGLALLIDTLEHAPGVTESGRGDLFRQFVDALVNRLRVVEYRAQHNEVADEVIQPPVVILGLPRTGTTVASCLLDQDPSRRSLLNWEAS